MTTHSLLCTKCGYSISGDTREELFATPRSCPQCYSSSWEIIDGEPFPCKESERKIIYQKILHILKWCANEKACQSPGKKCPLQKHCQNGDVFGAFVAWIKEAEI